MDPLFAENNLTYAWLLAGLQQLLRRIDRISKGAEGSVDCFQEDDFEKAYQEAAERVAKAWKPVGKKVQKQITEWKR